MSKLLLRDIWEAYLELHLRPHCRSWRNIERLYNLHLRHWEKRPAAEISRLDIIRLHTELGQKVGKPTANHIVEILRPAFNHAIDIGLLGGPNPCSRVKKFRLQSRERFLDRDEIRRLFDAIDSLRYDVTRDFLYLCLFTGARRGNVATMRWADISFEQKTWWIPLTKNSTSQRLPLTTPALAVLSRRKVADSKRETPSPWVFPSDRSPSGHLTKPELAWREVVTRANLVDTRIHDLRRTLASWEALTGANLAVIGATLNHRDLKSTLVYARLNVDAIRDAMDLATETMLGLPPDRSGRVVRLARRVIRSSE